MSRREKIAARLAALTLMPGGVESDPTEQDRFSQDPYHINESLVSVEGSDLNHKRPDQTLDQVMAQNWHSG